MAPAGLPDSANPSKASHAKMGTMTFALRTSPPLRTLDLAWAAGIIDGEGCIGLVRKKNTGVAYPRVAVRMTDLDVLERLHEMFGGSLRPEINRASSLGTKPLFRWQLGNSRQVAGLLMTIYPLVSGRRQGRIREVLSEWLALSPSVRGPYRRGHR